MNKDIRDRVNAIKSKLKELKQPKMGKSHFDNNMIFKLEKELEYLTMKVVSIIESEDSILVTLDNGEYARFYKFGGAIYSSVSDGINKSYFGEFKKDIAKTDWDVEKLKEIWIG